MTKPASGAGVIVGDAEVETIEHPAQMLPRDTQMVGWVAGVDRLAEVFERDRLAKKFPQFFEEVARDSVREFGYDIFDPATYPALGIDPSGRIGAALISGSTGAAAFFFKLTDEGKFKGALRNVLGRYEQELAEQQRGSVTVLTDPRGQMPGGIVIRDGFAMLVLQTGGSDAPVDYVEMLATLDPRKSLAAGVEYRKALGGLRDTDAMAFMNLQVLLADVLTDGSEEAEAEDAHWDTAIAEAKASGAGEDLIKDLEANRERERQWRAEWQAQQEAERAILEKLTDGVEGIGISMTVKRTGPVVDGQVVLGETAFLRRLVGASPDGLALPAALNGRPMAFWGGNVDVDAAFELVDMIAQADGENLHDLSNELQSDILGINPLQDLKPLLTGEAAFAVNLEAPIDFHHLDELPKQIGMTVQAAISDPKRVEGLLSKIDGSSTEVGRLMTKKKGAYTFDVPDFRPMQAVVAGKHLLVTTDAGLAGRMVTGTEGSMRKDTHPPGPYHVATLPNVGGAWVTDLGYTAGLFFMGMSSSMPHPEMGMPLPDGTSWEDVEASRMSRSSKKKQKELDAANERLKVANNELDGRRAEKTLDAVGSLGTTAFVVQTNARGFSLSGGQFIGRDSLGGVVEAMISIATERDDGGDTSAVDKAESESRRLESEYRALRVKDWERANKGGRKKSVVSGKKASSRKATK